MCWVGLPENLQRKKELELPNGRSGRLVGWHVRPLWGNRERAGSCTLSAPGVPKSMYYPTQYPE